MKAGFSGNSPRQLVLRRFMRHRLALASGALLLVVGGLVLALPVFEWAFGLEQGRADIFNNYADASANHWLGTDEIGRDELLQLLSGGRVSLLVGLVAALCASLIGTSIGLIAGYYGGRTDTLLMRFTDSVISLPLLPLLIILAAIDLNKLPLPFEIVQSGSTSLYRVILVIALFGWTTVARLVRAGALSVRTRDYVTAASALGVSPGSIMLRHILPNIISPIVVATTLSVGAVILVESVLSFLGLGIQPPMASWGNMLTNAQDLISTAPLLAVYPGLMIFVTVIAFNFLGDGLQDALDPRATRR
jgi:peptide/nickel transport system permease protein